MACSPSAVFAGPRQHVVSGPLPNYFGLFGNVFLPSVVGGDTFMVALAVQQTEKRAGILVASLLNRALDLLALLLLAAGAVRLLLSQAFPFSSTSKTSFTSSSAGSGPASAV